LQAYAACREVVEGPGYPRATVTDAAPTAPPVVAVVVTDGVGDHVGEALETLAAQDYPNLRVLVLAVGDVDEVAARVAPRVPGALLRPIAPDVPPPVAANEVLRLVEGAGFFCFLHDDVALDPPAVRLLVEETYRSNAGVAGPKLVEWDDPTRLDTVGFGVDKVGELAPIAEPDEIDQEQHDAVRDVFCLSSACLLVRTDLFRELGGFDADVHHGGAELDLCWRAHLSGARVLVVPAARGRHHAGPAEQASEAQAERDRLRTVLSSYSGGHLVRVLPQYALATAVQASGSIVTGQGRRAAALVGAWPSVLGDLGTVRAKRRTAKALRQVPDHEIRGLQVRGSARLAAWLRGHTGHREQRFSALAGVGRGAVDFVRTGAHRAAVFTWLGVLAVLVFGSRALIDGPVPLVGDLAAFPASVGDALRSYLAGWRETGLGSDGPWPTSVGASGLLGLVSFGSMDLARTLAVVGLLVVGAVGSWRLSRTMGSDRARMAGLVVYAAAPVGLNALAEGRWAGLAAHAAAPWVLARVARLGRLEPFAGVARPFVVDVVSLGLVLALVGVLAPVAALLGPGIALAVVAGSLVVGGVVGALRALGGAVAALVVAVVLHLPWSGGLADTAWEVVAGVAPAGGYGHGLWALVRFETGPHGATVLVLGLWVAAAIAVLVGRDWRLAWGTRGLAVALVGLGVALAVDRGALPLGPGGLEVALSATAAGLALAAACAGGAADLDVRGGRLSWRQPLAVLGAVAVAAGALPVAGAALDGRWDQPTSSLADPLAFLPTQRNPGGYRILWVGDPRALPLPGWELTEGLAYGLTNDGPAVLDDRTSRSPQAPEAEAAEALRVAADGATNRLGALLGPLAVRYVVVPLADGPGTGPADPFAPPASLTSSLANQLDLRAVDIDDNLVVYENTAWIPTRASLTAEAAAASQEAGFEALTRADLGGSRGVLLEPDGPLGHQGPLPAGAVGVAVPRDDRWVLEVDGTPLSSRPAFGWATSFDVTNGGEGRLAYDTPVARPLAVVGQAVAWVAAAALLVWAAGAPERRRRREIRGVTAELAATDAPVLIDLAGPAPAGDAR